MMYVTLRREFEELKVKSISRLVYVLCAVLMCLCGTFL